MQVEFYKDELLKNADTKNIYNKHIPVSSGTRFKIPFQGLGV